MLQLFRSGLTSYFATALLGLLIASFALWGIGGDVLSSKSRNIAEIGRDKITVNEYAQYFQNNFSEIQQKSDGKVTREMVIDQGLARKWAADLVQRETFSYTAHNLNIRTTDEDLRKYIMGIDAFQDTFGEFSKSNFERIAKYQGQTSSKFEKILRRDLERQSLMTAIASAASVPKAVEKTFLKFLLEERTAEIVTLPQSAIKEVPAATEETLKKYYEDHAANYMAPEYRDIRFIRLSASDFEKDVSVTDEEIEKAMSDASQAVPETEKRNFEQLLFDDKKTADKAYADLKAGRSFEDIIMASGTSVEESSVADQNKTDVNNTYGEASSDAIFAAKEGAYTTPIETDFGWRIFNITKISAEKINVEALKAETEKHLKAEKELDILYKKSELINDELAAGGSLSDISAKLSLPLKVAVNIDAKGYNSKGDVVAGIPADPMFLTKVFEALEDDEPILEEMDNGEYFIFAVDNIQPKTLRPFEDVKTSVVDLWTKETRREMARKEATTLLTKAQDGAAMKDLSKNTTGASYTAVTLPRNDQTGKVTKALHNSIFALDIGHSQIMPAADNNGFVVVKVLSRKFPDNALLDKGNSQLTSLLKQEYQQRFLSNYWRYLEVNLPVKINENAVRSVNNQLSSREE